MTVDMASLLLEVAVANAPAPDAQQTPIAKGEGSDASEFEELVLKLLGGSAPEMDVTDKVRAGQQVLVEEVSDEADSEEESGKPKIASERLLGSAGASQELLEMAPAALVCAIDPPQIAVDPFAGDVAEVEALPADGSRQSPIQPGSDLAQAEIPVSIQPAAADPSVAAPVMPAPEKAAQPDGAPLRAPGWHQQPAVDAAAPPQQPASPPAADANANPTAEARHAGLPVGFRINEVAENAVQPAASHRPGLEVATPGTAWAALHEKVQLRFDGSELPGRPSDQGAVVMPVSPDQAAMGDAAAPEAVTLAAFPPVESLRVERQDKPAAKEVVPVSAEVRESAEMFTDVSPVERASGERRDTAENRPHNDSTWMPLSDNRLPGIEALRAVEQRPAFAANGPPEEVIGSKLIHEIVRSAKVHLFEGGADMTLRLEPPHLGVLHMSVSAQEGAVTASLQTSTETARRVLEANLFSLKQALAEAGINVDSINVSVGGGPDQGWTLDSGAHGGRPHSDTHGNPHFQRELTDREIAYAPSDAYRQAFGGRIDYLA